MKQVVVLPWAESILWKMAALQRLLTLAAKATSLPRLPQLLTRKIGYRLSAHISTSGSHLFIFFSAQRCKNLGENAIIRRNLHNIKNGKINNHVACVVIKTTKMQILVHFVFWGWGGV